MAVLAEWVESRPRIIVWLFYFVVGMPLAGCHSENHLPRLPIHGTVTTISGEKLNGSISFIPDDGSSGPAAMATLTDGKYQFDENNGPAVGPHKVIVRRTAAKNRIPTPNTNDTKIDTAKQNSAESKTEVKTEWKLTANLTANVNQYNFTLEP